MSAGRTTRHLAALLLIGIGTCVAQEPTTEELFAQARKTYAEQGAKPALPLYEQVLARYRAAHDTRGEAIVLGYLGNAHKRLGDLARAEELLQKALAMKRELKDRPEEGKTLSHLGLLFWDMGAYERAIQSFTDAIALAREIDDRRLEAAALNNLGLVYDEQGRYSLSLPNYERALELQRKLGLPEDETYTLGNIGGVHLLLGRFREALPYYQQSLAISERLGLKPSQSQDHGNLALCYLGLADYEQAMRSFDRALTLAREAGLAKEEADWRKGKAAALVQRGRYSQALTEFAAARDTYRRAGLRREMVEALHELGSVYAILGDTASASHHFQEAIALSRELGHPRGVVFNLLALGDLERRAQHDREATAHFEQALDQARAAQDHGHVAASLLQIAGMQVRAARWDDAQRNAEEAQSLARGNGARALEAEAALVLGESARARGATSAALSYLGSGEQVARAIENTELSWRLAHAHGRVLAADGQFEPALAAYRRAIAVIEDVRSQLGQERFRAGYLDNRCQVYVDLVELLLRLDRIGEAFSVAERLRARAQLDQLDRGLVAREAADRQAEQALRERIRVLQRSLEQELANAAQPSQRSQRAMMFSDELTRAQREYQALLDDLRLRDPQYVTARTTSIPDPAVLQASLPAGVALLEYVVAPETLSVFVLTHEHIRALSVPVRAAQLEAKIELLRDLILRRRGEEWRKPAASLFELLLLPLQERGWLRDIQTLRIVPHAALHYLPFAALPARADSGELLGDSYLVGYLPAAAALADAGHATAPSSLFALAPSRSRLQYASREARSIARYFPSASKLLLGEAATEASFKQLAGQFQTVHFATHGYFNRFAPLLSGVELQADRENDGRLEVHEILGLRLRAALVTLSACDTALGSGYFTEIPPGDEFVGLTRAFLFAGSSSVLATLWEVNDRSTMELMRGFYRELGEHGRARALAMAQQELRARGGRYRHPYYWAPFVLVGKM